MKKKLMVEDRETVSSLLTSKAKEGMLLPQGRRLNNAQDIRRKNRPSVFRHEQ